MQFLHHPQAGALHLRVEGDAYRYLFKVRRFRREDPLPLRNLYAGDDRIYFYSVESLDRRRATLVLESSRVFPVRPKRPLHLGWCLVDPKTVEKSLPALNELGVSKITFIRCKRSQHNFRLETERLERILINSCQQCGRSDLMALEFTEELKSFVHRSPDSVLLDFSGKPLECGEGIETLVVGPEGGIDDEERALFEPGRLRGLETPMILRSESAAVAAAARLLL
ncbi:16S rRNA (uracil(1498)-N(3))-methyltransferase [Nitratifractor sp.]